jgi:Mg2+ and Co2+ transporter CorA
MKFSNIIKYFKKRKKKTQSPEEILSEIFAQEAMNLVSSDRSYYLMVAEKINLNERVFKINYEKELGRLRIVYHNYYIDLATVDIAIVDFLALFGIGIPQIKLVVSETKLFLIGEVTDFKYQVEVLGLNLNYDVDKLK